MKPCLPNSSPHTMTRTLMAYFTAILLLVSLFVSGCGLYKRKQNVGYTPPPPSRPLPSYNYTSQAPAPPPSNYDYRTPVPSQPRVYGDDYRSTVVFTFTDRHRHTVRDYYHRHPHHHHGKKHKSRKHWRHKRKSHLPSEIQIHVIPVDLIRLLPPAPRGTQYIYDDDQVLLVDLNTRIVLDVINISVSDDYNRRQDPPNQNKPDRYYAFDDRQRTIVLNYYTKGPGVTVYRAIQNRMRNPNFVKLIQKNRPNLLLERNDTYPGANSAFPIGLTRQLPPLPKHIKRFVFGSQIVVVNWNTKRVIGAVNLPVELPPNGTGRHGHRPGQHESKRHYGFDDKQRAIILNYYTKGPGRTAYIAIQNRMRNPNFVKLIQKNRPNLLLERNDTYPGANSAFPIGLTRQLPLLPKHIKRFVYGSQIILVNWKTKRVLDAVNLPIKM